MRYIPLGTSSGSPTLDRNVSAAALEFSGGGWILLDCGEAAQHQLQRSDLKLSDLQAVFVTHAHGDHVFGLFGFLCAAAIAGRRKPLLMVAPPEVERMVKTAFECTSTHLEFELDWRAPQDGVCIGLPGGASAEPVKLSHRVESHGYLFRRVWSRPKVNMEYLESLGIGSGPEVGKVLRGECAMPGMDMAKAVSVREWEESAFLAGDNCDPMILARRAAGAQLWAHEATYMQQEWDKDGKGLKWGHSSALHVGRAAAAGQPEILALTHFSARYGLPGTPAPNMDDVIAEAQGCCSCKVIGAMDLVPVEVQPKLLRECQAGAQAKPKP